MNKNKQAKNISPTKKQKTNQKKKKKKKIQQTNKKLSYFASSWFNTSWILGWNPRSVMSNMPDCDIVVS